MIVNVVDCLSTAFLNSATDVASTIATQPAHGIASQVTVTALDAPTRESVRRHVSTLEERVQAGARWLDVFRPAWYEEVNLNWLIMSSCTSCVLGQLYEDFDIALDELNMPEDQAIELGFFLSTERDRLDEDYPELTEIWRELIKSRKEV